MYLLLRLCACSALFVGATHCTKPLSKIFLLLLIGSASHAFGGSAPLCRAPSALLCRALLDSGALTHIAYYVQCERPFGHSHCKGASAHIICRYVQCLGSVGLFSLGARPLFEALSHLAHWLSLAHRQRGHTTSGTPIARTPSALLCSNERRDIHIFGSLCVLRTIRRCYALHKAPLLF